VGLLQVLTPDQGIGHKLEGDVYSHQEDFYRAELAYRNAYEKTPTAQGALLLSNAQYHAEKPEAALSTLQKWLAVQPADTPVKVQLATLLDRLGYQTDAIAEYEQLIEQNPENAIALNNLAWLYGTGDPKGLEYAERAVELAPERPEMLDTLGWLLVKSNKAEHGLLLLQQAIILAPEMPDIRFHLAFAYDRLGRTDEAREELDVLLNDTAENPRFTRSEELLKLLEKLKYQ
jgi:Flp pilus assembly protein TadD